ncbi:MAG TPA: hypothetical protein VMD92_17480, partial [Acidobacteriaceae bacterium]|nr:hypothetical protein [Acidobacteriaceae bacterium]
MRLLLAGFATQGWAAAHMNHPMQEPQTGPRWAAGRAAASMSRGRYALSDGAVAMEWILRDGQLSGL